MNLTSCTHRWLSLAENLLANQQVEACLRVCDEVEMLIDEMRKKDITAGEYMRCRNKVNSIRRQLNTIMVSEVRRRLLDNVC